MLYVYMYFHHAFGMQLILHMYVTSRMFGKHQLLLYYLTHDIVSHILGKDRLDLSYMYISHPRVHMLALVDGKVKRLS